MTRSRRSRRPLMGRESASVLVAFNHADRPEADGSPWPVRGVFISRANLRHGSFLGNSSIFEDHVL